MGNNRFRLSHVMPNTWFYKLRDMGVVGRAAGLSYPSSTQMMRQRPAAPTRKSRSPESAIRRSFELAQTHRGGPFMYPSLHRPSALDSGLSDDKRTDEGDLYQSHQQVAQPRKHRASSAAAGSARKNSNSTPAVVGSSISAGCSCRTTVSSSSRKSRDSSSDDHHLHHVGEEQEQFIRKSRVKMQMPSKHVLQYGFNNVAGLPSPVHGDEEEEEQEEQAVAAVFKAEEDEFVEVTETVKEMPCNCKACVDAGPGPRLCLPSSSSSRSYASYSPSEADKNNTEVTAAVVAEVPKRRLKTRIGVSGSPKLRSVYQEKPNRKQKQYDKSTTRSRKSQQQQQRQSCSVSSGSQKPSSNPRGFAVVKRSYDPEKDFRESMVEMILHNQLSSYKDLLKLLECYLSLNSQEYHHTIVEVFQQVWLDLIPFPKT